MRNYILATLLLASNCLFAQYWEPKAISMDKYQVLDSAYIKVTYSLTFVKDTLKAQQKSNDIQVLLIGKKVSKYYSQSYSDYNEYVKSLIKKGADAVPKAKDGTNGYEIFKNYPAGKITVTDMATLIGGNYLYFDDQHNMNWNITNERTMILSYSCQKATTTFRGRTYEAWFATEIPINNGPWKFGGLPGLILKVSDSQNYFKFECIGIEHLKKKEPIKYYNLPYIKSTRKECGKLYRRLHNDFAGFRTMQGGKTFEVNTKGEAKEMKNSTRKHPYNPIEKE